MMMKQISFAVALMAIATSAQAAGPNGGVYVSGAVGYNMVQDQDARRGGQDYDIETDDNASFTGAVGYKYREGERGRFRTELEVGYRSNDVEGAALNSVNQSPAYGEQEVWTGMVNGYYDFSRMNKKFVPYVGAGIGVANLKMNDVRMGTTTADDDSTNFAWQVMVGADYKITEKTAVYGDVRYFSILDPKTSATAGIGDLDMEYDAFTVSAGLKYDF